MRRNGATTLLSFEQLWERSPPRSRRPTTPAWSSPTTSRCCRGCPASDAPRFLPVMAATRRQHRRTSWWRCGRRWAGACAARPTTPGSSATASGDDGRDQARRGADDRRLAAARPGHARSRPTRPRCCPTMAARRGARALRRHERDRPASATARSLRSEGRGRRRARRGARGAPARHDAALERHRAVRHAARSTRPALLDVSLRRRGVRDGEERHRGARPSSSPTSASGGWSGCTSRRATRSLDDRSGARASSGRFHPTRRAASRRRGDGVLDAPWRQSTRVPRADRAQRDRPSLALLGAWWTKVLGPRPHELRAADSRSRIWDWRDDAEAAPCCPGCGRATARGRSSTAARA